QLGILGLELAQAPQIGHRGPAVARLPLEVGLPANPVLAENLRDRNAVLAFFQDLDDLGFAKPRLPHEPSRLPRESLSLNCLSNGEAYVPSLTGARVDIRVGRRLKWKEFGYLDFLRLAAGKELDHVIEALLASACSPCTLGNHVGTGPRDRSESCDVIAVPQRPLHRIGKLSRLLEEVAWINPVCRGGHFRNNPKQSRRRGSDRHPLHLARARLER